jgi:hypothetical protein
MWHGLSNNKLCARSLAIVTILTLVNSLPCSAVALEPTDFRPSELRESIEGALSGKKGLDYLIRGKAGQILRLSASSKRPKELLLRVLPPAGEGPDLFSNAATAELSTEMTLPANGDYVLKIGLRKPGAKEGLKIDYRVVIDILNPKNAEATSQKGAPKSFSETLTLHGISFKLSCPNEGSLNKLTITPKGLKGGDTPIEREVDGTVYGADVADLNHDGSPEIYVYAASAGSGSYGSLIAYSANKNVSLTEISLPDIAENKAYNKGYMGHDEFSVVEGSLVRRFPIFREGEPNSKPTGGIRQLQYRLKAGEAGWILRVDKVVEY